MKRKNKGFSMVELIIVIAIMAILAAALAPALIKYVRKARRTRDVDAAGKIYSSFMRAAVEMEDGTLDTFGGGELYLRWDMTLNDPPVNIEDYAFGEYGGIPKSATFSDYYWLLKYDNTNGRMLRVYLTPSVGSSTLYEVYPDHEAFLEGTD